MAAFPKFANGKSWREDRAERRTAVKAHEDAEKRAVRQRDKVCRWPHCTELKRGIGRTVAHLDDKGMGGDKGHRTRRDRMLVLCYTHHQGPRSLHSGDLRIETLTDLGTDGPCLFFATDEDGREYVVAEETGPFLYRKD